MSSVDNRIVNLKFDNADFMNRIKGTIGALDSLEKGLKMDKATDGFSKLNSAVQTFSLSNMESSLERVSSKFGVMGAVGFTAISRLTDMAFDMGKKVYSSIVDPIVEGGKKRALNIEQARFQFQGLGMDVEAAMKSANDAVTGTAYGLDEAARLASMFGASGMQAGEGMTTALRGVAGVAAMSGSAFMDVGDIFSNVAGKGRAMTEDFNRLASRGVNGFATLAKYLRETGQDINATEASVREMATKGAISFELFSDAMSHAFGEHATKANETYTGSLSNMRAALARLGQQYFYGTDVQKAEGFFERQRKLFNALTPAINAVGAAIKPVFDVFNKFEGIKTDGLVASIEKLYPKDSEGKLLSGSFFGNMVEAGPIMAKALENVYTAMSKVTGAFKSAFSTVFSGGQVTIFTTIATAIEKVTRAFIASDGAINILKVSLTLLFGVFKILWTVVSGIASIFFGVVGDLLQIGQAVLGLLSPFGNFLAMMVPLEGGVGGVTDKIKQFVDWINNLRSGLTGNILEAINGFREKLENMLTLEKAQAAGAKLVSVFKNIGSALSAISSILSSGKFKDNPLFSSDSLFAKSLFKIRDACIATKKVVVDFYKALRGSGDEGGEPNKIAQFFTRISEVAKKAWDTVKPILSSIGQGFKAVWDTVRGIFSQMDAAAWLTGANVALMAGMFLALKDGLKGLGAGGLFKSITGAFDGVKEFFESITNADEEGIPSKLLKISAAIALFAFAIAALAKSDPQAVAVSTGAILASLSGLLGAMFAISKMPLDDIKGKMLRIGIALILFAVALNILSSAMTKMAGISWNDVAKGLTAVVVGMGVLVGMVWALKAAKAEQTLIKAGAGMVLVAGALYMLAGAVAIFAAMDLGALIQGGVAITALLGVIALFAYVAGKGNLLVAGAGMVLITAALYGLAGVIAIFGSLPIAMLAQAGVVLLGLMTMLVAAAILAKNALSGALGILALAGAMAILAPVLAFLGTLPFGVIVQGLSTLAVALTIFVIAANALKTAATGAAAIVALAASMVLIAFAIKILGSMSIMSIVTALVALAGALAIFGVAAVVLSPIIPVMYALAGVLAVIALSVILFAAAALLFSVAAAGVAGGLIMIAKAVEEILPQTLAFIAVGAGLIVLGAGLAALAVGVIALGLGFLVLGAGLLTVGAASLIGVTGLAALVLNMAKLLPYMPALAAVSLVLTAFGIAATAAGIGAVVLAGGLLLAGLAIAALMQLASVLMELGSMSWEQIGKGLAALGGALLIVAGFSGALGMIGGIGALMGAGAIWITVQSLDELAAALKKFGSMGWDEIGRGLTAMGGALAVIAVGSFANSLGFLGGLSLGTSVAALDELAEALLKFGDMSWEEIKTGLTAMGGALAVLTVGSLANTFNWLGAGNIERSVGPLGQLADVVNKFAEIKGVPSTMKEALTALGEGLGALNNPLDYFATKNLANSVGPIKDMADSVRAWEGLELNPNIATQLTSLAEGWKAFDAGLIGWIENNKLGEAVGPIKDMASAVKAWEDIELNENIATQLSSLAEGWKAFDTGLVGWLEGNDLAASIEPIKNMAGAVQVWSEVKLNDGIGPQLESLADGWKAFDKGLFSAWGGNDAAASVGPITEMASAVKAWDGIQVNENIAEQLSSLAKGWKAFDKGIFEAWGGNEAAAAVGPIKDMAGAVSAWKEVSVNENIATQLSSLADGYKAFDKSWVASWGSNEMAAAIEPMSKMVEVVDAWSGKSLTTDVKSILTEMAEGFKSFDQGWLQSWDSNKMMEAVEPLKSMADVVERWSGVKYNPLIKIALVDIAEGFGAFDTGLLDNLGGGSLAAAVTPVGDMAGAVRKWEDMNINPGIKEALTSIAEGLKAFSWMWGAENSFATAASGMATLADAMKTWETVKIPADLGTQMETLASAIKKLADAEVISPAADAVKRLVDLLPQLGSSASGASPNIDMVTTAVGSMKTSLVDTASTATTFKTDITNAFTGIDGSAMAAKDNIQAACDGITSAVDGLGGRVSSGVASVKSEFSGLESGGTDSLNNLKGNVSNSTTIIGDAISDMATEIDSASDSVETSIDNMGREIKTSLSKIEGEIKSVSTKVVGAIKNMESGATNATSNMSSKITSAIKSTFGGLAGNIRGYGSALYSAAYSTGTNIVNGMVNGINNGSGRISAAARSAARSALSSANAALGVRSPSREFFKTGHYVAEGMALGIRKGEKLVEAASESIATASLDIANRTTNNLSNALSGLSAEFDMNSDFEPTIRPVLDLTSVREQASQIGRIFGPSVISTKGIYADASGIAMANRAAQQAAQNELQRQEQAPVVFNQNNYSPKALSEAEIYRRTKSQLAILKGALETR